MYKGRNVPITWNLTMNKGNLCSMQNYITGQTIWCGTLRDNKSSTFVVCCATYNKNRAIADACAIFVILRSEFCWKEVQDLIFSDCYLCSPLREGTVNVSNKLWCNKSEGGWQKFPPCKICWPTWGFLPWSQTTKNAEKLRVANLTGWHHSGAVCSANSAL